MNPMQSYIAACMGMDESTADTYKETIYVVQAAHLAAFIDKTLFVILNHITKFLSVPGSHRPAGG